MEFIGDSSIAEVVAQHASCSKDSDLVSLSSKEDITRRFLVQKPIQQIQLPPAKVSLPKAALSSFACWCARNPGLFGVLIGEDSKQSKQQRSLCTSIIVGKVWEELHLHPNVKAACEQEHARVCGAIVCKHKDKLGDIKQEAVQCLSDLRKQDGVHEPLICAMAPCLT